MRITFDSVKDARNIADRGLSFERAADLHWEAALAVEDTRRNYGERRMRVVALLGQRLRVAVVTYRGDAVHIISFRKANRREVRWYGEESKRRGVASG